MCDCYCTHSLYPSPQSQTNGLPRAFAVQVGQDRLTAAFNSMMNEDPKAEQLLDQAMDKFEVSGDKV